MNFIMLLVLFVMVWMTFGMMLLGQRAKRNKDRDEEIEGLRARIRTLEALLTDQDRMLRRDIDRLA